MNKPWIEKYRPTQLSNIIGQEVVIDILKTSVKQQKPTPNLLFYGSPGTGKTTTILAYCYEMFGNDYSKYTLELNASSERGISVVKTDILSFAKMNVPNNKFKMIILDEADAMTPNAQTALRKIMENYSNTRFCIICNYPEKIIPAIISRCMEFKFNPIGDKYIDMHLRRIYEREFSGEIDDHVIKTIIMLINGDLRKGINLLQNYKYALKTTNTDNKKLFYDMEGLMMHNDLKELVDNCKTANNLTNVYNDIKNTNYSIKNIIKQLLLEFNFNDEQTSEMNKLLKCEVEDKFILLRLITILQ